MSGKFQLAIYLYKTGWQPIVYSVANLLSFILVDRLGYTLCYQVSCVVTTSKSRDVTNCIWNISLISKILKLVTNLVATLSRSFIAQHRHQPNTVSGLPSPPPPTCTKLDTPPRETQHLKCVSKVNHPSSSTLSPQYLTCLPKPTPWKACLANYCDKTRTVKTWNIVYTLSCLV